MNTYHDITGLILAGGEGRRLGGVDKGLQVFQGKRLIDWAFEHLSEFLPQVYISANRNLETYRLLTENIVPDHQLEFLGPLAGIQAGLSIIKTPYLLCIPCDCPVIPKNLVEHLYERISDNDADWVHARSKTLDGYKAHPTFLICHRRILPKLEESIKLRHLRVMRFAESLNYSTCDFDDQVNFMNLNSQGDFIVHG